jgi:hypothetical protein
VNWQRDDVLVHLNSSEVYVCFELYLLAQFYHSFKMLNSIAA